MASLPAQSITSKDLLDGLANPMVRPGAKVVPQKGEIATAKAK